MLPLSRSYLLRIWLSHDDPPGYRMLLENSMTGERKGFSDIADFTRYLLDETDQLKSNTESSMDDSISKTSSQ
jgi:hypothetical protein